MKTVLNIRLRSTVIVGPYCLETAKCLAKSQATAPAYEAIASRTMVEKRNIHVGPDNPYSGAPNPETDAKWKSLLRGKEAVSLGRYVYADII